MFELQGVTFSYPKSSEVFSDVSFSIKPGGFFIFKGEECSGKTTLLYILCGLLLPTKGKLLKSFSASKKKRYLLGASNQILKEVAFISSLDSLVPHLTVQENILFPYVLQKSDKESHIRHADEALQWLGIKRLTNKYPERLSKADKILVLLARAILCKPKCIMIDEPMRDLSVEKQQYILSFLSTLNKNGITIVVTDNSRFKFTEGKGEVFSLRSQKIISGDICAT